MTNLKEKMKKFNQRWSVASEKTAEEEFAKFKTRIINIMKDINNHLTGESIREFCQYYGIKEHWHVDYSSDSKWNTDVIDKLNSENDPIEFYRLLEIIFALDIKETYSCYGDSSYSKRLLLKQVKKAIEYSNIELVIIVKDGDIIFHKSGEKKLDEKLVEYPLSFLDKKSGEHFIDALNFYKNKNWVKSAESLRRTLEEFLREVLDNKRGLNANIAQLQKVIKTESDPQIRNIVFQVFNYLDKYFDENSKHNDGDIGESENEFLIYQVGLLLRFVSKINFRK